MDVKLKCILLDDELPGLAYLKLLCEQIGDVEVVKAFNNSSKLLEESKSLEFDFCILDIEVPGIKGIEVASLIDKPVIFVTAYKEYASDAFDLEAVDYVKKPIQIDRLQKAVQKARKVILEKNQDKKFVQLNTDRGKALIYFDKVIHITTAEKDKRDKIVRLKDGKELTLKNISFNQLLEILPESKFCRINKKDIISLDTILYIANDQIVTTITTENSKETIFILGDIYKGNLLSRIK
jgi:DNA-binding LytR/AlgR family response regulator